MNLFSTQELMDRLLGSFDVIHTQWTLHPPESTHLWEITRDQSALEILEKDVADIGEFFAQVDDIGEQSEVFLLAECIAYLRLASRSVSSTKQLEDMIETIANSLMHQRRELETTDGIYTPLSFRMAQYAYAQGIIQEAHLRSYREVLLQLAHHFVLRDGNLTPEEDRGYKTFHAALS